MTTIRHENFYPEFDILVHLTLDGNTLYMAAGEAGIFIYDISNVENEIAARDSRQERSLW